jgi:hypothetical protein
MIPEQPLGMNVTPGVSAAEVASSGPIIPARRHLLACVLQYLLWLINAPGGSSCTNFGGIGASAYCNTIKGTRQQANEFAHPAKRTENPATSVESDS